MTQDTVLKRIYVASTEMKPDDVHFGAVSLHELVESRNAYLKKEYGNPPPLQWTVEADAKLSLERILHLKWREEFSFRNKDIDLCILDGRCFDDKELEVFTIRAHHFPPAPDYPRFCVLFPKEVVDGSVSEEDARQQISKRLNCHLLEPTEEAFQNYMRCVWVTFREGGTLESILAA